MEKLKFKLPLSGKELSPEIREAMKLMIRMSKKATKIARAYRKHLSRLHVEWKTERDLVSEADREIEQMIRLEIENRFPDHGIIGEEFPDREGARAVWIVDPIDGTTSFVRGQWHYSISIAFRLDGELVLGGVTSPELNHFFAAVKGQGAYLNGRPIQTSSRKRLSEAVFTTGFACIRNRQQESNLLYFPAFSEKLISTRRFGSAALDCCYTAAGILDGFWEMGLNLYDVAAGIVIAREAGALTTDFSGGTDKLPREILVANPDLHRESLETIAEVRKTLR